MVCTESIGVYFRDRAVFHSYVAESSMTTKDHGTISSLLSAFWLQRIS